MSPRLSAIPALAGLVAQHAAAPPVTSLGLPTLDQALRGGLSQATVHDIYAARQADGAAAVGLALALASLAAARRPWLWVRQDLSGVEMGQPYAPGLGDLGIDPAAVTLVRTRDMQAALQAGLDASRCTALGAVLIELWGEARVLDLAASRRLALAAQASGVTVLMARIAAAAAPSAAATRWQVAAAPSRALPANAPGNPVFHVTLLRQRNGAAGQQWHLEWNSSHGRFARADIVLPAATGPVTPLSGAVVPLSAGEPGPAARGPDGWGGLRRRAG